MAACSQLREQDMLRAALRMRCSPPRRALASKMPSMTVFDRDLKLAQRARAAVAPDAPFFDYLRDEVARRTVERLDDIKRKFPSAVDLGAHSGHIRKHLGGRGGVKTLLHIDSCREQLVRDLEGAKMDPFVDEYGVRHEFRVADEEQLDLEPASYDLVISSMSLHWVNDLPGLFARVRQALRPDGVFICSMLGGETLQELRSAFAIADQERLGGVTPHVSPFVRMRDCGSLLSSAGFALPAVDYETITTKYPDMFTLMEHLRAMGEANAALERARSVPREVFLGAAAAYQSLFGDKEGLITATFQVFYLIGWAPARSQPRPLQRGTATASLKDIDKLAGAGGDTA